MEGDVVEDHGLIPSGVNTDAFKIWSRSAVAASNDSICWLRSRAWFIDIDWTK